MDDFTRKMVRVAVAQTCLNVGWSTIHSSPLEILTDLLCDYIGGLCKRTNNYAFLFNQTEPNLDHLALAFQDLGISIPELEEYVNCFDNNNSLEVPQYPIPKESSLNFLKPGSREVVTRPVHIHEHLPPMYPHLEDEASVVKAEPSPTVEPAAMDVPTISPGSSIKRRGEIPTESAAVRRARALAEEETRTLREISSVMMTTSGFLSHAREGKLPEVRTIITEPEPEEPPLPSPPPPTMEVKVEPLAPPPPEIKPEKKKKKKSHEPSKKAEKEAKVRSEDSSSLPIPIPPKSSHLLMPDDSQVKKLATVKETNKLKVLKPGATKAIALTPTDVTTPLKSEKKHKLKRPNSPAAAIGQFLSPPKGKIPKIEKVDKTQARLERMAVDDLGDDAFPDVKITAEPDKQKLNIFKKITKVKEEPVEEKIEEHVPKPSRDDEFKRNVVTPEIKDEKDEVDVINLHSPTAFGSIYGDDMMPVMSTAPKASDVPKLLTDHKKKKKDKHKEKKERETYSLANSPVSSRIDDLPKPKSPEVVMESPDDGLQLLFGYPGAAPLPPALASNPLIPQINIMPPFGPRMVPPVVVPPPPQPPKEKSPPPPSREPPPSTPSTPDTTPASSEPTSTPPKKKEKKDKKNKDKIKKKKEKKEKQKSKEKSEKKKLKLLKKKKLEEKLKQKKEKKDKKKETQNVEEKRGDSPSVPKITFKLGPDPQREQSPNPKITFKPLIKKEEDEVPKKHDQAPVSSISKQKVSSKAAKAPPGGESVHHKVPGPLPVVKTLPPAPPAKIKTEPETSEANQLWICPACGRPDDGSPMIACDACDMWYHYTCVGIQDTPEGDWFCMGCISRRTDLVDKKKKHKKKK